MGQAVASGAVLACSFGASPGALTVAPSGRVLADGMPLATIMDSAPTKNIAPFGMCSSLANPQVASATSAAQGVLTPQPCVPAVVSPWTPGSKSVSLGQQPVLTSDSTCSCTWAGVITVKQPGTRTATVA